MQGVGWHGSGGCSVGFSGRERESEREGILEIKEKLILKRILENFRERNRENILKKILERKRDSR